MKNEKKIQKLRGDVQDLEKPLKKVLNKKDNRKAEINILKVNNEIDIKLREIEKLQ